LQSVRKLEPTERQISVPVSKPSQVKPALWISWNVHRRSTGLCDAWGVPLQIIQGGRPGISRWAEKACRTLSLLQRVRPRILFVQNPSLALTVLASLCRPLFGYFLVVDAHNEGVRPFARTGQLVGWLTRWLLRSANTTIVTNIALARDVSDAGGCPLVLPDRLPEPVLPFKIAARNGTPLVVVIASYQPDEPIEAIMRAAVALPDCEFAFTGEASRYRHAEIEYPSNVRLTGYLADKAFWKLLAQADVICDLTLKPDCLVCGAYEALALAKPMVLSDNPATREIFGPAAILTGSGIEDISRALRTALERRELLEACARETREVYRAHWPARADAVWDSILTAAELNSGSTGRAP
jgi:hypothetical protein